MKLDPLAPIRIVANCSHCGHVDGSRTYPPPNWKCFACGAVNNEIEVRRRES